MDEKTILELLSLKLINLEIYKHTHSSSVNFTCNLISTIAAGFQDFPVSLIISKIMHFPFSFSDTFLTLKTHHKI